MCQANNKTDIKCPNCAWAAANGYRLRPTLMFNPKIRSGVPLGGYRTALVKLSEENTVERSVRSVNKTKKSKPIKEQPSNKENIKKPVKRSQTQSERSKARKMKRRQLQQDELAAKRANITTSSPMPTTEDVKIDVPKVETGVALIRTANLKKKPKTHFRKTKKPGRA